MGRSEEEKYCEALVSAGIEQLICDTMWPSADVTPESLGRNGWDGSKAIDWITDQMTRRSARPPSGTS